MVLNSFLALAGLALLTVAADHLVVGSSRLAARMRVSPIVVGVVVIGLGTSMPEFLVSGVAAARGDTGIAIGNIVGSNILNVTLILGVAALTRSLAVSSSIIGHEVRLSAAAGVLFAVATWVGLTLRSGLVLALAGVAAVVLLLTWARTGRNRALAGAATSFADTAPVIDVPPTPAGRGAWVEPIRALVGLIGVLAGAELLVANASTIATRLGVSPIVIGLTIVALGTSLPELVTTVAAQRRGESELVVGNLFGSNLFNSLLGGAVIGIADGVVTPARPAMAPLVAMVLSSLVSWALLRRGLRLSRIDGIVLLGVYALCVPALLAP